MSVHIVIFSLFKAFSRFTKNELKKLAAAYILTRIC